jgi:hypothetical protein
VDPAIGPDDLSALHLRAAGGNGDAVDELRRLADRGKSRLCRRRRH